MAKVSTFFSLFQDGKKTKKIKILRKETWFHDPNCNIWTRTTKNNLSQMRNK